jgi:outer membrane protein assembly factor BamB
MNGRKMNYSSKSFLIACVSLAMSLSAMGAESWPDYRGPMHNGHSEAKGLPTEWAEGKNVKWKVALHGRAWSSPIVIDGQVWVSTATKNGQKLSAICVDAKTGKILFDKALFNIPKPQYAHKFNSYASPSPVAEPGRIYLHWGSPGTACLDTKTFKVVWSRPDLKCDHHRGAGSSPLIYKDLLILTMDGSDLQFVTALNKTTGKTVWTTKRSTDYNDLDKKTGKPIRGGDLRKGYSTPLIISVDGKDQLISPGARAAFSYDPLTGKEIWTVRYKEHSSASRPIFGHGMVFFGTGYSTPQIMAVKPTGKGDVTKTHMAWKTSDRSPKKPSTILVGDLFYMLNDLGIVSCLEAKTGAKVWQGRISGNYSGSLLHADGKLYAFSEDGPATILAVGRTFKKLAENKLNEGFMASPAVIGKALILRTKTHLYRIEQ